MAHRPTTSSSRHRRVPRAARAQEPAALHHLRQRRRRQEHAHRPPALRSKMVYRGPARRARGATRSKRRHHGASEIDFALLVDGLQAEREQGITIDVAYRYFSTDKRKFIVADTPGHEQYTRNMATGASTADLRGHPRRRAPGRADADAPAHAIIVSLLGIRHVVAGRQQDGPRRLLPGALPRDRAAVRRVSRSSSGSTRPSSSTSTGRVHRLLMYAALRPAADRLLRRGPTAR